MKVSLDIQAAVTQQAGIGRYTRMLASGLPALAAENHHDLQLTYFDFRGKGNAPDAPGAHLKRIGWCPGSVMQQLWKRIGWPPYDKIAGMADLFHFPNFIIPPLSRGKAVVTVHDLSFRLYPQFAETRNLNYLNTHLPQTLKRADAVITISENSKREICHYLGTPPEHVHVTHLGVSPDFKPVDLATQQEFRDKLGLARPYILSVGTIEPRKNLRFLVDVFERMGDIDVDLVIAGGKGWKHEGFFERLERSPARERIKYLEYIPDGGLPTLYSAAEIYATPSFYEGFGLPPLEALACGTPVVSSTGGSLPEVLGSAALLVDGFNPTDWADALLRALDTPVTEESKAAHIAHAASFTWDRTLQQTLRIYEETAG